MKKKNYGGLKAALVLAVMPLLFGSLIFSCGKTGTGSATSMNIQYQVVNLSPTLGAVSLYIDYRAYNSRNFYYPSPSGYFYLSSIDTPFQIRASQVQTVGTTVATGNIISRNDVLKANLKYTLYITGLKADSSITGVFLTDTSSAPALGRGKVRFLNASPQSTGFDVLANDTLAFKNIKYLGVSPYMELPAGGYNFQIFQTGTSTNVIGTVQNLSVLDGRLYTIYCYGLAGRTDSLAFGTGTIVNK